MLHKLRRWFGLAPKVPPVTTPPAAKRAPRSISARTLENFASEIQPTDRLTEYRFPELPPGVLPSSVAVSGAAPVVLAHDEMPRMALDWGPSQGSVYGWIAGGNGFNAGLWFPGYPYLAELAQISEYRAPSETVSTEMTRKWVELITKGDGDKTKEIEAINARMEQLEVRDKFRRAALQDGFFGRSQIYLNIDDADETVRQLPLEVTPAGIKKGSLKSIQVIEPYWSTPYSWNSSYPERADFYVPSSWYIMGRKTHSSRLLTFIGREVPDILKPAYNFSGMSLSQLMQPYVEFWFRTRKSVNDLISNFSTTVLATDMDSTLEDTGDSGSSLLKRLRLFVMNRNNQGVMAIQKDTEELVQQNVPLSGLDALQAQSQEHMAAPAHIPLIKMFGVTPTGLNATGEGEIQVWYDHVHAMQENLFGKHLRTLLNVIMLDVLGHIDPDISFNWVSLDEPTNKELSEIRKSDADAGVGYINSGVISPDEERQRLQSDPTSGYKNLKGDAPEPQPDPNLQMQMEHEKEMATTGEDEPQPAKIDE